MIDYDIAKKYSIVYLGEDDKINILSKYEDIDENIISSLFDKPINIIYDKKYNFDKNFEEFYCISVVDEDIKKELSSINYNNTEELFSYILEKAHSFVSSDIHIISEKDVFIVKFRINSILRSFLKLDYEKGQALIRIIKLKSNIDISKTVTVLEGRFEYNKLNYRVSIMPTINGEKITLRILGNIKNIYTFSDIGLNLDEQKLLMEKINKSNGFILVTGATGSGKSTTIFSILHYLSDGTKNIVSIEDPVEYTIDGTTQILLNNLDFYDVLKFVLRQDPQIINIGEIRDENTAKLAIQSANTGHLVFSTMHTNSSVSSVNRLLDLGVNNFDIASSITLIISQRLIRVLCPHCKKESVLDEHTIKHYNLNENATYYTHIGCKKCYNTGYDRQLAVFEILDVDENVKRLILQNNIDEKNINITTLKEKLIKLLQEGVTDITEISKYI